MANYQPNESYNGQSFLKNWWGIVKENFGQIFSVFNSHANGENDRHTASDVDCADGTTVQQCLNNEAAARSTADTALGNRITTELLLKVDKEDGKGLSECDYTAAEREKLAGIEDGANHGLSVDNTVVFTPTEDYQPATKKYVDDSVSDAGGGDMLRTVYDQDRSGVVDDAEKLGGQLPAYYATQEFVDTEIEGVQTKIDAVTENIASVSADVNTVSANVDNLSAKVDSIYTYGTEDLTAGESGLETGKLHFVYE